MFGILFTTLCQAAPVDRVVAVVADEIVLSSDTGLIRLLLDVDAEGLAFWRRDDAAVEAALIRAAAGDLALYQPDRSQVERRLGLIEGAIDDTHPLRTSWGLNREGLRTLVRRRLVVEAWLLRNVTVPPSAVERFGAETETLLGELDRRLRVRRTPVVAP